jgi:methylmalonyl-CoA mutase N-terminal domain/subunit
MQQEVAKGAYERQKRIENGEDLVVSVNCFTGEHELEVKTSRLVPHPYDPEKMELAENKQIANLKEVRRIRDNRAVSRLLKELEVAAKKDTENLMPRLIECVKAYISIGEMCDTLREVFGEYKQTAI